jgi:protoporphyrinogen oxidase
VITTTKGPMPEEALAKSEGTDENDNEIVNWVEYRLGDELVHRSVHVHLKRGMFADGVTANFS